MFASSDLDCPEEGQVDPLLCLQRCPGLPPRLPGAVICTDSLPRGGRDTKSPFVGPRGTLSEGTAGDGAAAGGHGHDGDRAVDG